jgi:hypothetical protein
MAAIPAVLPPGATLAQRLARLGGPCLAVVAAFALAFKPTLGLWSAGAPWVLHIYQDVSLDASDLALALLAACGWRDRPLPAPARVLALAGAALLLCLAASIAVAEAPPLAFAALAHCALGLLAALAVARRPALIPWLLLGGVAALAAQLPFAALQLLTQSTFPAGRVFDGWGSELPAAASGAAVVILPDGTRWQRALGTFPHPNILGGAVAVALVLALPPLLRGGRPRWPLLALWALGWPLLLVTFSRAALLAALLGCALALLGQPAFRRRSLGRVLGSPLASLALTALCFGPALRDRLTPGETLLGSPAVRERDLIADIAWALIRQHPLLGVGAGNFTLAELRPPFNAISIEPAHAVPLLLAAEAGVLAGLAWLTLLVAPLAVEWHGTRRLAPVRLALPATLLTLALLDHYLWTFGPGRALFWLALGIWVAGGRLEGSEVRMSEGLMITEHMQVPELSNLQTFEPEQRAERP